MSIDLFSLRIEIELKKQRLVLLAEIYGRKSPVFLALNDNLDKLIVEYYKRMKSEGLMV